MATRNTGPHQCGQCGYDLTGLDSRGRCPECGELYDMDHPSEGWFEYEQTIRRRLLRWRTIVLGLLALAILSCGGISRIITGDLNQFFWMLMLLGAIGLLCTAVSYVYQE